MQSERQRIAEDCERWLLKGRQKVPVPKVLACYNILEKLLQK
jgi:hypothetical protein